MILPALYAVASNLQAVADGRRAHGTAPETRGFALGELLRGEFAVVGVETTGKIASSAEITEIAALRVGPGLVPVAKFEVLVEAGYAAAPDSASPSALAPPGGRVGVQDAMRGLAEFVAQRPLFADRARFGQQVLARAAARAGIRFANPFYDSQLVAWSAWPGLPSYQLAALAELLGLEYRPAHRALATVAATLELLHAASESLREG